ncbi:SH3-domain-containing protein [Pholiota conissans]|uniref:SH3-domain-containing protein n=1 Tax=Pholiota conissans TaxID=109636 RepID=A0A9P5ZBH1_9AGAR|nr:SH3-domain-containing protein [Pholiota conissans]
MTNTAISYVLAQTQANIEFLLSAQQISQDDARDILAKLSAAPGFSDPRKSVSPSAMDNETNRSFPMPITPTISDAAPAIKPTPPKIAALSRPPPPIPSSFLFKARALWGYNENNNEAEDLRFSKDDIIDVIDDKNADWWRGRLRGNEGLFPSSYVSRIPQGPSHSEKVSANVPLPGNMYSPPYPPYQYQHQPPQNSYYGPPPGAPYPPYQGGPQPVPNQPAPNVVVNAAEPKKKHGFLQGSMGNTLAHSAVGGVGFGAGSAVGGGIINALF